MIFSIRFQNLDLGAASDQFIPRLDGAYNSLSDISTYPDQVISRERLLQLVWGWEYPAGTRTVDTRMFELRKALGDDPSNPTFIETQAGEGYCFIAPVRMLP